MVVKLRTIITHSDAEYGDMVYTMLTAKNVYDVEELQKLNIEHSDYIKDFMIVHIAPDLTDDKN